MTGFNTPSMNALIEEFDLCLLLSRLISENPEAEQSRHLGSRSRPEQGVLLPVCCSFNY